MDWRCPPHPREGAHGLPLPRVRPQGDGHASGPQTHTPRVRTTRCPSDAPAGGRAGYAAEGKGACETCLFLGSQTPSLSLSFRKVLSFPLDAGSSPVPCRLLSCGQPCDESRPPGQRLPRLRAGGALAGGGCHQLPPAPFGAARVHTPGVRVVRKVCPVSASLRSGSGLVRNKES